MVETILVATDGSDAAEQAARHAVRLADVCGAQVYALHVVSPRLLAFLEDHTDRTADTESLGTDAMQTVEQIADEAEIGLTTTVERGDPAETIMSHAEAQDVDLIAIGTRGRTGLPRYLFGSVAETVLRGATRPVLATQVGQQAPSYDDILVPIASEDGSRHVPQVAIDLATQAGATVHLFHVIDRRLLASARDLGPARAGIESALEDRGRDLLASAAAPLETTGMDVKTHFESGLPVSRLREFATTASVDLVVIPSHRRRGSDRLLQGSVAEGLLRSVKTPVLTVDRN